MQSVCMSTDDELPLAFLFQRAQRIVEEAVQPSEKDLRQECFRLLRTCEKRVDSIGIFSPNEQIEDIATGDLKYLLVASLLGDLLSSTQDRDPLLRKEALESSLKAYSRFFRLCEQYGLAAADTQLSQASDPETKRQLKIQRFQKEKLVGARLKDIKAATSECRDGEEDSRTEENEDTEREAWLLEIELALLKAIDQSVQVRQEIEMLAYALSLPEEERSKPLPPPPADLLGELHSVAAHLGKQRQQIVANVLRPSHRLPTRSLREQADIEIFQAHEQADKQERAAKEKTQREADENYILQKQRAWDDWKDDHERGAGNDKLRPTA